MHVYRLAGIALSVASSACGRTTAHQDPAPLAAPRGTSQSLVGRWALVTLVRNGEDLTNRSAVTVGATVFYNFNADGTFRIVRGDSIRETGTWSQDTSVSPKLFDHIPDVDGRPGPFVPGIFAISGDSLTISIIPPNPTRRHPAAFRSTPADSSWLLVFRRPDR